MIKLGWWLGQLVSGYTFGQKNIEVAAWNNEQMLERVTGFLIYGFHNQRNLSHFLLSLPLVTVWPVVI